MWIKAILIMVIISIITFKYADTGFILADAALLISLALVRCCENILDWTERASYESLAFCAFLSFAGLATHLSSSIIVSCCMVISPRQLLIFYHDRRWCTLRNLEHPRLLLAFSIPMWLWLVQKIVMRRLKHWRTGLVVFEDIPMLWDDSTGSIPVVSIDLWHLMATFCLLVSRAAILKSSSSCTCCSLLIPHLLSWKVKFMIIKFN